MGTHCLLISVIFYNNCRKGSSAKNSGGKTNIKERCVDLFLVNIFLIPALCPLFLNGAIVAFSTLIL